MGQTVRAVSPQTASPGDGGCGGGVFIAGTGFSHSPDNRCPTVTPTTIALAMSPFSVYCTFIQLPPKEASHGIPSFRIAVPAQDGGHSGLWRADWPLAGTSEQRLSARFDVLYGVCGTSADSANGYLPAHRTRPTCHEAFYRAAVINCAGQKWL